jgi:hypothetical protein
MRGVRLLLLLRRLRWRLRLLRVAGSLWGCSG